MVLIMRGKFDKENVLLAKVFDRLKIFFVVEKYNQAVFDIKHIKVLLVKFENMIGRISISFSLTMG